MDPTHPFSAFTNTTEICNKSQQVMREMVFIKSRRDLLFVLYQVVIYARMIVGSSGSQIVAVCVGLYIDVMCICQLNSFLHPSYL